MNESEKEKAVSAAKARLSRNGIKVNDFVQDGRRVKQVFVNGNAGIKVWGAVDCLVNLGNFTLIRN